MTQPRSQSEYYEIFKTETTSRKSELTDWYVGSINDIMAGGASILAQELQKIMLDEFAKTFFDGASGADLERLATDHFGTDFAKPGAQKSVGIVKFSRPTAGAGDVLIPAGTVVKTDPDANGETQRYETTFSVTITGTEINASIIAIVAGPNGDVDADKIINIESALTDPTITVTNEAATSGGEAELTDAEYREYILNLIQQLKGATLTAIQATAETVAGVETVTAIEFLKRVIEWDEGSSTEIGESFLIPYVKLYIADANGEANNALVQNVDDAVSLVRAAGVKIETIGATASSVNWTANLTLNPAGPNYTEFQNDTSEIKQDMTKYLQDLPISSGFSRNLGRAYILAIWGPSGTNDLTDFQTSIPAGDIAGADGVKIIPGTIETA